MQAASPAAAFADTDPPLWEGLGGVTYRITTANELAQSYFNQGLRLTYAFNHSEAQRAFRKAQRLDKTCAMCAWGDSGRLETAKDGTFRIETALPGGAAPCLDVTIFARGLLKPLRTRVYLAPEAAVRADPILAAIAGSPRLATLIAKPAGEAEYRWDVRLQGEGETVFFAA